MGGFGSGKSWWRSAKDETDTALRLDVRWLARNGYLPRPGELRSGPVTWSSRGQVTHWITVKSDGREPDALVLEFRARAPGADWREVTQRVALDRTPCHYGGTRPWFRCPGCGARCAVFWSVVGFFCCRGCNGLAYSSTREKRHDRMLRRAEGLQAKLKWGGRRPGEWFGGAFEPPPRPKGMYRRTYERLRAELWSLEDEAMREWTRDGEALLARIDRSLARHTGGRG